MNVTSASGTGAVPAFASCVCTTVPEPASGASSVKSFTALCCRSIPPTWSVPSMESFGGRTSTATSDSAEECGRHSPRKQTAF